MTVRRGDEAKCHAKPRVNRHFWETLNGYWRSNSGRYKDFGGCQLDLFREGAAAARVQANVFTEARATHGSYLKPRQKTLNIPLDDRDNSALTPFCNGIFDVAGRDEVAGIILSIGCRSRGVI